MQSNNTADKLAAPKPVAAGINLRSLRRDVKPWHLGVFGFATALATAIILVPPPSGVPPQAMMALALTAFTVVLWATSAIPQPYAAIGFIAAVLVTGTAPPNVVLSGFLSSTLGLVFGGFLIGTAAERSGFGSFVARRFLGGFAGTYPGLLLGILIGSTILSFLVPSNIGRIAITVPVVITLARDAGYAPGSNGYIGLVMAAVAGNFTIALAILPGNLLNIMVVGSGETLYGVHISYMQYLLMCGPVLGIVKGVIAWKTLAWVYPSEPPQSSAAQPVQTQLSADGRRIGLILATAITLWATDFLHGVRPGFVALAAGIACVIPRLGVLPLRELVDPKKLLMMVWVGTVLGLGAVLIHTGASTLVSGALVELSAATGRSAAYGYFAIAYLSSVIAMLATIGGAVPTMATAAGGISAATGLPIDTAILSISAGLSAIFFPYSAAPLVVGLAIGKISMATAMRFTIASSVLTWLIVIPLNALWWRLLGALP